MVDVIQKVGGSTGGDFKNQRPQSPRVNPLRMTTLEEQEESISSPVTVGGDLPKKMEVCRSLSANTDDVISTLKGNQHQTQKYFHFKALNFIGLLYITLRMFLNI